MHSSFSLAHILTYIYSYTIHDTAAAAADDGSSRHIDDKHTYHIPQWNIAQPNENKQILRQVLTEGDDIYIRN